MKIIDSDRLKKYADEVFKVAQNELDDLQTEIENSNGDLVKTDVVHFFWLEAGNVKFVKGKFRYIVEQF